MTAKQTKLASYWNTQFAKICIGMKKGDHRSIKWIGINHEANSLFEVIANRKFTETSIGRKHWKSLISGSTLQTYCNKEGFNINPGRKTHVRIGLVANNENDCHSCNSGIGFGASVRGCGENVKDIACGNVYKCVSHLPVFGYILVQ